MQVQYRQSEVEALRASAGCAGSCGELIQGQFKHGEDFLVTFPVNLWSEVSVTLDFSRSGVISVPAGKVKAQKALEKTLAYLGVGPCGARVSVLSEIPEGKGLASSTADIVAACRAAAGALGKRLPLEIISQIAIQIEPSDGLMYPGCVVYNHRQGKLLESLGVLPPVEILAVDLGAQVDTLQFNQIPKNYTPAELEQIETAYQLLKIGMKEKDLEKIGLAATQSARVNQRLLPKADLELLIEIAGMAGAYGVNVAHSGTIAGLLFAAGEKNKLSQARKLVRERIKPEVNILELQSL
jgi:L-threonine kinase